MSKIIESDCGNITTLADDNVVSEIFITDAAKQRISELLLDEEEDQSFLRVAVQGGGCSGFQYYFGFDTDLEEDDIINEWADGKVVVDAMSIEYIKGATIDFVQDFMGEHFAVQNKLATSQCGCGSSFGVDDFAFDDLIAE